MVEHRTLTPLVLVRIQLPQPKIQTPLAGVLIFDASDGLTIQRSCFGSTMSKREQTKCSLSANECHAATASESSCPNQKFKHPLRVF